MQLPKLFYGLYREVKPRLSKVVTQLRRGQPLVPLVEAEGLLDTETTPGLIVFQGPSPLLGGQVNFQMWLLWWLLLDKESVHSETAQRVFEESLTTAWGTLGLAANDTHFWFIVAKRHRPFLRAVRTYWDELDAVGPRYSYGINVGYPLWSMNSSIKFVLARRRIPNDILSAPLPPGGIGELIDRTDQHLH